MSISTTTGVRSLQGSGVTPKAWAFDFLKAAQSKDHGALILAQYSYGSDQADESDEEDNWQENICS